MSRLLVEKIRTVLWRLLGTDPQKVNREIDLTAPRLAVMDMAIEYINTATRFESKKMKPYNPSSLMGDYLEFGVFKGETFNHVARRAMTRMPWMRFFAFDSFKGLPVPTGVDTNGEFEAGQFSCSESEFRNSLTVTGIDMDRVVVVSGWYSESLTPELKASTQLSLASLVLVDCDLYESTCPVLKFLTDLVTTGTILIFDDWFHFRGNPSRGVQLACKEWLEANPSISLVDWHLYGAYGKTFLVVRRDS